MHTTRRDFLKTAPTAALGTAIIPGTKAFAGQRVAGSDAIRIGLIGCGGRGTGAVGDAISSSAGVTLVAMGDMFPDRLTSSRAGLSEKFGKAIDVTPDRSFTGLDAYQKVIASDVNYIILATPPGFRPIHLAAAVAANKNIFTEKPVAVDGPGIRAVLEPTAVESERARIAGTQRRHQTGYLETMKRIQDGNRQDSLGAVTGTGRALEEATASRNGRTPKRRCATGSTSPGSRAITSSSSTSTTLTSSTGR